MISPRILVVGSFVMDLIVTTQKFPGTGETVLGKSFSTAPGGKGANQAVQAARLGAAVTMVGKVGSDYFGEQLIASAQSAGICTKYVAIDSNHASAVGNVVLEEGLDGKVNNRIIVVPGANLQITPFDIAFLEEKIADFDMVMLQMEIPMEINELVAKYAFAKGVPVMLNSAPAAPLSAQLMSHLTYISPNEHEATDLTGVPIRREGKKVNLEDVYAAANALMKMGVKNVIITLGSAGAVFVNVQEHYYSPCVEAVKVKDPTAAGDSFVAAFSVGVCAGMSHRRALDFANCTAAVTVSRMGAQPSLPTLAEVKHLI